MKASITLWLTLIAIPCWECYKFSPYGQITLMGLQNQQEAHKDPVFLQLRTHPPPFVINHNILKTT